MRKSLLMTYMVDGCIYVYSVYILHSFAAEQSMKIPVQVFFFNAGWPTDQQLDQHGQTSENSPDGGTYFLSFCWVQVLYNTGCI